MAADDDRMPTRLRIGLAGMLAGLALILAGLITTALHPPQSTDPTYGPAGETADQPAGPVGAGLKLNTVDNTVDPPAAHDSDIPTGAPSTTTAPKPTTKAPATVSQPTTTLITISDNGTAVVPKPETQDPPPPVVTTRVCSQPESCQP